MRLLCLASSQPLGAGSPIGPTTDLPGCPRLLPTVARTGSGNPAAPKGRRQRKWMEVQDENVWIDPPCPSPADQVTEHFMFPNLSP